MERGAALPLHPPESTHSPTSRATPPPGSGPHPRPFDSSSITTSLFRNETCCMRVCAQLCGAVASRRIRIGLSTKLKMATSVSRARTEMTRRCFRIHVKYLALMNSPRSSSSPSSSSKPPYDDHIGYKRIANVTDGQMPGTPRVPDPVCCFGHQQSDDRDVPGSSHTTHSYSGIIYACHA